METCSDRATRKYHARACCMYVVLAHSRMAVEVTTFTAPSRSRKPSASLDVDQPCQTSSYIPTQAEDCRSHRLPPDHICCQPCKQRPAA